MKGAPGEVYNVGSGQEQRNIDTVRRILKLMGRPQRLIRYVQDRPGHDYRYSLDSSKVRRLGWSPEVDFATGLEETVRWCLGHRKWLDGKRAELKALWRKVYKS
jgi:dTDP-glucose 4,6-dehydratase